MAGCSKPGGHQGASHFLIGTIQQGQERTRANVRIVEVETGIVKSTGRADASGTDDGALRQSIAAAMDKLDRRIECTGAT
jgi:TolB-like protein